MNWDAEFVFRPFSQDPCVLAEVLYGNEYELPEQLPPGSVVIDVGAHIGCFAVQALRRGAAKVLCYEPDPANFALLRRNVAPYDVPFARVEVHNEAVSADRGLLHFHRAEAYTACGFLRPDAEPGPGAAARCVTLDDVLEPYPAVELLKLDCETAEWRLLAESQLLPRCRRIACELHPHLHRPDDARIPPLLARLDSLGFDAKVSAKKGSTNLALEADRRR